MYVIFSAILCISSAEASVTVKQNGDYIVHSDGKVKK